MIAMNLPLTLLEPLLLLCILASWTCSSAQVQRRDAACDGSFSFFNASAAAGITHCKRLKTLGAELGWRYGAGAGSRTGSNATTLDVVFSAKPPAKGGWVAWGVNPGSRPQMVGTRALVAFSHANGTMAVYTYSVTEEAKTGCNLEPSEVEMKVAALRAEHDGATGVITIWATLGLPPEYDATRLNHVWQVGPRVDGDVLNKHSQRLENFDGIETIDLTSGRDVGRDYRRAKLRGVHGILSVVGWSILMPVGVIVARYFKEYPIRSEGKWFLVHKRVQTSAFVVGACAWAIGLSLVNGNMHFRACMAHRIIGILVFSLAALQMMALRLRPRKEGKERNYWNMYHYVVGYTLLVLIVINVFKGFDILQPPIKWRWIYVAILCLICCIALVLEIAIWVTFMHDNKPKDDDQQKKDVQQESH